MSWQEQEAYAEMVERIHSQAASVPMQILVNIGNEPDELAEFRELCNPSYDIVNESDAELLKLRDQLRTIWVGEEGEEQAAAIVQEWWQRYPLDRSGEGWNIFDIPGTFFPSEKNFRALVGRICVHNLDLLARCANPECARYFVKARRDQKFCLEADCLRYGNRQRANKYWHGTHAKRSKKGR
jgi:hypothetical protein